MATPEKIKPIPKKGNNCEQKSAGMINTKIPIAIKIPPVNKGKYQFFNFNLLILLYNTNFYKRFKFLLINMGKPLKVCPKLLTDKI